MPGDEVVYERGRPAGVRVELEAKPGVAGEPALDRAERRRGAEAERVDEPDGARLDAQERGQAAPVLAQGQIQRRRLVGPVAVLATGLPRRRLGPLLERREVLAEGADRPLPRERQRRPRREQRVLLLRDPPDILPEAVRPTAEQTDLDGHPR
jgi:hypothetical protein